jgi:hypothetical protein
MGGLLLESAWFEIGSFQLWIIGRAVCGMLI